MTIANQQNLSEQRGDFIAHIRDKCCKRGEVRLTIPGNGDEQYILPAGCLYSATADDSPAIGQQDNLDEHCRIKCGGTFGIVFIAGMKGSEVEFMIDKMAQRELKTASLYLLIEVDRQQFYTFVNRFESCHTIPVCIVFDGMIMPVSRDDLR